MGTDWARIRRRFEGREGASMTGRRGDSASFSGDQASGLIGRYHSPNSSVTIKRLPERKDVWETRLRRVRSR